MSTTVTLNNVGYTIPSIGESNWGDNVSNYLIAISTAVLQKSGGTFTLTSEIDFGATYGLKLAYIKSRATNPSSTGFLRLGNGEGVSWRNAANTADVILKLNSDDDLEYKGSVHFGDPGTEGAGINIAGTTYNSTFKVSDLGGANVAQTILHKHSTTYEPIVIGARSNNDTSSHTSVTAGQNVFTIYGAGSAGSNYKFFGAMSFKASSLGTISNTSSPGDIAFLTTPDGSTTPTAHLTLYSDKSTTFAGSVTATSYNITGLTASRAVVTDASKNLASSAATATEVGYLSGVTSAIQTQINAKEPTITTLSIAKGGTNSGTALNNNRVMQSNAGAIIEAAAITAARALISDANGIPTHSTVTSTELGYLSGSTGTTGTGLIVRATSPTLTTPVLGVATATSINSTNIPSSKTLVVTTDKLSALAATTSAELAGVISDETGSGALVFGTSPTLGSPTLTTPSLDIATMTGQGSTPSNPSSGYYKTYVKTSTGKLTVLDSSGVEKSAGGVSTWVTATPYAVGDLVLYGNKIYVCVTAHTSSSFIETDIIAQKWVLESNSVSARNSMTYGFDAEDNDTGGWTTAKHSAALTNGFLTSVGSAGVALSSSTSGYTTATTMSFATTSTNPLFGTYSYNISTSSSGTTVGDMAISPVYNIPLGDRGSVYSIKHKYKLVTDTNSLTVFSGLYSTSTLGLAIYDVTNAAWIQPAGCYNYVTKSVAGTFSATWQIPTTCSQYQVVIFTPYATGATTISFLVDEFYCGQQVTAIGPAMSDWVSYTPTGSFTTNTTYTGFYKRYGDNLEVRARLAFSGAPNSVSATLNLPSGLTIDTSKLPSGTDIQQSALGTLSYNLGAASPGAIGEVGYNSTTSVLLLYNSSATIRAAITQAAPGTIANGNMIDVHFSVPIVGWSSNTVSSADYMGTIVDAKMTTTATTSFATGTTLKSIWNVNVFDSTGGMVDTTNSRFNIISAGDYQINFCYFFNLANAAQNGSIQAYAYVSGVNVAVISASSVAIGNTYRSVNGSTILKNLKAGDYVEIYFRQDSVVTFTGLGDLNSFSISKLQGSPIVQATDTVACSYGMSAGGTASPNNTTITLSSTYVTYSKNYDLTSSFNTTSGIWTCPVSGKFTYNAMVEFAASLTGNRAIFVVQAGSISRTVCLCYIPAGLSASIATVLNGAADFNCVAGDTLTIQVIQVSGGTLAISASGAQYNHIDIKRVGN